MADFYSHNTIRKYTLGLLDTFNDIKVERTMSNDTKSYIKVPITYGSRDKAFTLNNIELEQWYDNNYNILPRMALSLITLNKDPRRDTNKLHKINQTINDKVITFQYNAVSYIFSYELAIATRSMTELTMILEQILPAFNPTYNLLIKEMDVVVEPTIVPVSLTSVDIDTPTNIGQDDDIRICGAIIMLDVRGNVYKPFTDASMIEHVRLYLNAWEPTINIEDERRSIKYEFDVVDGTQDRTTINRVDFENTDTVAKNAPVINGISGLTSILINDIENYEVIFSDIDDEDHFTFIWNILPSSTGTANLVGNSNIVSIEAVIAGTIDLSCQVVDRDNNISNLFVKNITIS